jgi:heme/copper-type cytochrome/quinol oxidase subunit 2
MLVEDNLEEGDRRLLEVDKPLVVPVNVPLRFLITSMDVLHS